MGKSTEDRLVELEARLAAMERASGLFAPDKDLDGPKGDPTVKFEPRGWIPKRGAPPHKGRTYSRCDPEFLDALADALQWMAENPKEGADKYALYNRKDAARARGWARRIRGGWRPPAADPAMTAPSFDEPTWSVPRSDTGFDAPTFDEEDTPW